MQFFDHVWIERTERIETFALLFDPFHELHIVSGHIGIGQIFIDPIFAGEVLKVLPDGI